MRPRQCKEPTEIHRTQTHKPTATYANKHAHKFAASLVFVSSASQHFALSCMSVKCWQLQPRVLSSSMRTYLRSTAGKQYFSFDVRHKYSNLLKPSGCCLYRKFNILQILRSAHTVYLCVLCGSENKQRLFPHAALTDWLL